MSHGGMEKFNTNDGYAEALFRGYRMDILTQEEYSQIVGQVDSLEDLKQALQSLGTPDTAYNFNPYGKDFLADKGSDLEAKDFVVEAKDRLILQFEHVRSQAMQPLATFLDYTCYSYMIDNILLLLRGEPSAPRPPDTALPLPFPPSPRYRLRVRHCAPRRAPVTALTPGCRSGSMNGKRVEDLLKTCNPLGRFEAMAAVTHNPPCRAAIRSCRHCHLGSNALALSAGWVLRWRRASLRKSSTPPCSSTRRSARSASTSRLTWREPPLPRAEGCVPPPQCVLPGCLLRASPIPVLSLRWPRQQKPSLQPRSA